MDVTFITTADDTNGGTTLNFGTVNIGSPAPDRLVVVVCTFESSNAFQAREIQSCTIGGTGATRAVHQINGSPTAIFYLPVATGTSANIDVTCNSGTTRGRIGVWNITGQDSNTPIDTAVNEDASGGHNGLSVSVDIPADAGGICAAANGSPANITWSGATERYDIALGSNSQFSGADIQPTGSVRNNHSVSTSHSSSDQPGSICVAIWGAAAQNLTASTDIDADLTLSGTTVKAGETTSEFGLDALISGAADATKVASSDAIDLDLSVGATSVAQKEASTEFDLVLSVDEADGTPQKEAATDYDLILDLDGDATIGIRDLFVVVNHAGVVDIPLPVDADLQSIDVSSVAKDNSVEVDSVAIRPGVSGVGI